LLKQDTKASYLFLVKWLIIAFIGGISGTFVAESFYYLLKNFSAFLTDLYIPKFLLPFIGGAIVGNTFYLLEKQASGEGLPSYIRSIDNKYGYLKPKATFFKYIAALFTLSFEGSGGVVGPLCRVSAGFMSIISNFFKKFWFSEEDQKIATICGVSGSMGAILHTPIGGGIFAVEILAQSSMNYNDLFPAILASSFSFIFSKAMGFSPFYKINAPEHFMNIQLVYWLFLISLVSGFIGMFFIYIYKKTSDLFEKINRLNIATIIGGGVCSLIALINVDTLGTGSELINLLARSDYHLLHRNDFFGKHLVLLFLLLIFLKILATSFTIGSGLSAGFTAPTIFLGILTSLTISHLIGVEPNSPTFYAFIATGISAMLAAVMNVPIASGVIVTEMLGFNYSFPAAWGSIIAFQIARHKTIYRYSILTKLINQAIEGAEEPSRVIENISGIMDEDE